MKICFPMQAMNSRLYKDKELHANSGYKNGGNIVQNRSNINRGGIITDFSINNIYRNKSILNDITCTLGEFKLVDSNDNEI